MKQDAYTCPRCRGKVEWRLTSQGLEPENWDLVCNECGRDYALHLGVNNKSHPPPKTLGPKPKVALMISADRPLTTRQSQRPVVAYAMELILWMMQVSPPTFGQFHQALIDDIAGPPNASFFLKVKGSAKTFRESTDFYISEQAQLARTPEQLAVVLEWFIEPARPNATA